jgi:hypothetical protein
MKATGKFGRWLLRSALALALAVGLLVPMFASAPHASAMQSSYCDYLVDRGITASSDYWVGFWFKWANAHGCFD